LDVVNFIAHGIRKAIHPKPPRAVILHLRLKVKRAVATLNETRRHHL